MCPKTPKVKATPEKKPQYLRNPFLDGLALGTTSGRNALRVDRSTSTASAAPLTAAAPPPGIVIPSGQSALWAAGGGGGRGLGFNRTSHV